MKQFDLKAALLAAGLCLGLTHGAQASNEWASFMAPPLPVERNGPIADEQFALIKQGGPWHQLASNRWGQSEAHLLALLKSKQWQDASAWLKAQSPDVNAREPITGATALSLASLDGRLDLVRELIRHGAELDRDRERLGRVEFLIADQDGLDLHGEGGHRPERVECEIGGEAGGLENVVLDLNDALRAAGLRVNLLVLGEQGPAVARAKALGLLG